MKFIKRTGLLLLCFLTAFAAAGCKHTEGTWKTTDRLKVMTTLFPYYDFVRNIAGDTVELKLLLPAGQDTHSFEPTPADMIDIQKSDLFFYNGGEAESWVPDVLSALDTSRIHAVSALDSVQLLEENTHVHDGVEDTHEHGAEEHEHNTETITYDEHIWTSPANAIEIVKYLTGVLQEAAPQYADLYAQNSAAYIEKLTALDAQFRALSNRAVNKTIVVGDKFPLLYFVQAYGFSYQAAFSGCSHDTEPSAGTMAALIHYVKENQIPVVYYLELSSHKTADAIAEAAGAQSLLFHSCHSVSRQEWEAGVTYLSLMEQNLKNLEEGVCQ